MTLHGTPGDGGSPLRVRARRLASRVFRAAAWARRRLLTHAAAVGGARPGDVRPPVTADTLDLSAPEVAADPFPYYRELRRGGPVHFLPRQGFWLVIDYEGVQRALAQPQVFSSRAPEWMLVDRILLGADPPEHTAARQAVAGLFSAKALEEATAFAERAAERLLRPLCAGAGLDVLRGFGAPLSEEVAAHLIGFDDDALAALRAAQTAAADPGQWFAALDEVCAVAAPRTHAYSRILNDGKGALGEEEARKLIRFLWIAGTTTTRRVIATSVMMLLLHASLRPQVESDPALLSAFVQESLRLHPPEHSIARVTTAAVELSGVKLPAGAAVKLCLAAANRDPAQFADPHAFLPGRSPNRHLSFGSGVHRCVGASLARLEAAAALRVLLRLAPHFRAATPLGALRQVGFTNDTERLEIKS